MAPDAPDSRSVHPAIRALSRVLRLILFIYPSGYRELLGGDMHATFVRECTRIHDERGSPRLWAFGLRTLAGFALGALRARTEAAASRLARPLRARGEPSSGWLDRTFRETRYAVRRLRRSPTFTLAAVLTLGLGIGGSAAMFALVNRILLQPLPYPNASRVVALSHTAPGLDLAEAGQSWATFLHYRDRARTLERIALYQEAVVNLTGGGPPRRVTLAMVTPSLFAVLGSGPLIGRVFGDADARQDASTVVLISERLWRSGYGADPAIVGRTVEINGGPHEVAGVLGARFDFPNRQTDVWMNLADQPAGAVDDLYPSGVGLIAPERSAADVEAELRALIGELAGARAQTTIPFDEWRFTPIVEPLKTAVVGEATAVLWIMFGAVSIVLLVTGVNITTLFLVRAAHRQREIALRRMLGAVKRDMRSFFLSETLLLAAGAGALGVAIAWASLRFTTSWGAEALPRLHEVRPDMWMLGFTGVLTVLIGIGVATVTARRAGSGSLATMRAPHSGLSRSDRDAHRILVAFQVALAFVLLVGAGLLLRSFANLRNVDPGFDAGNVLTFDISLPYRRYPDYDHANGFFKLLLPGVAAVPGVVAAGAISDLPLTPPSGRRMIRPLEAESGRRGGNPVPAINIAMVMPGYFDVLGIPLLEGTPMAETASPVARPVYLSAPLARRLFGDRRAVGQLVRRGDDPGLSWNTVAGVVGPVRLHTMHLPPTDILYIPMLEMPSDSGFVPRAMTVVVQTAGVATDVIPRMRSLVAELDPELSISNVGPLARVVSHATARWSFASTLLTVAAATALLLGVVGLYAILSFTVTRRLHEIGIRMALGARAGTVRWMIVRQAGAIVMIGLLLGGVVALAGARVLRDLLYELAPHDVMTFALAATVLLVASLMASDVPARRAARVDPMRVIRSE